MERKSSRGQKILDLFEKQQQNKATVSYHDYQSYYFVLI